MECRLYGCPTGQHEPNEARPFPLPGEKVYGRTVIASVWLHEGDDGGPPPTALLLLLRSSVPYFEVAELDLRPHGNLDIINDHENIVPAVREYEDNGGY